MMYGRLSLYLMRVGALIIQVRALCEKAKEILMEENNVQVFIVSNSDGFCWSFETMSFLLVTPNQFIADGQLKDGLCKSN